ncbi:MAG: tRNA uridine-5-carboxymethylaminomethyl(34) synthesis enzyme MnmG, partial [Candidatus Omnitrophica bacterium]|nr:tRNA uridine-5-carboxymethylaminomethyl(34) synthesis enzyme MnmG [Candidatus Omnitrophota bacterium]
ILQQVEIELKYEGYIKRELQSIKRFKSAEKKRIPIDFNYKNLYGLSSEAREKLIKIEPSSFGQACRIDGLRQADLSILLIHLEKARQPKKGFGLSILD